MFFATLFARLGLVQQKIAFVIRGNCSNSFPDMRSAILTMPRAVSQLCKQRITGAILS